VELSEHRARLRELLPPHASVHNPIDATAGIDPATFEACLDAVLADGTVHAVLAIAALTAVSNPVTAITEAVTRARSNGITTPVLAVQLSQPEAIRAMPAGALRPAPSYADPATAVRALTAATCSAEADPSTPTTMMLVVVSVLVSSAPALPEWTRPATPRGRTR
jgi:acyl-CoA synthetase (NDP forming)